MKLSILIPVYDERFNIHNLFNQLKNAPIDKCNGINEAEIIIVDDGSRDGTTAILEKLCSVPFVFACGLKASMKFLPQATNRGKGFAIRLAISHSTGDIVIIQDADLEYSPHDYPKLVEPIVHGNADAVFGSRFRGCPRRVLYFWHSLANKFLTIISNMFFNINLTDMGTGYKVIRGNLARLLRLTSCRFGIEPELTARLCQANARIYEVPVRYSGRTYLEGKKIRAADGLAAIFHILKFGLWDTEAFQSGQMQSLNALDASASIIYEPLLEKALRLARFEGESCRILEVGAGIGTLTNTLLRYGSVMATDTSCEAVRVIENRFMHHQNIHCHQWDATTPYPRSDDGKFDLIVAFNVLEHIENDLTTVQSWSKLLTDNGRLILLVPNYPALYSVMDQTVGHFRRYSRKGLSKLMVQAGYQVENSFFGNALGALGWLITCKVLKLSRIPARQVWVYALYKRLFGFVETQLERAFGLNLVVSASVLEHQPLPSLKPRSLVGSNFQELA